MTTTFMLKALIKALILPPGGPILLVVVGLLLWRSMPRLAATCITAAVFSLYLLSTPWLAEKLVKTVETIPAINLSDENTLNAQAIVVLGGGRNRNSIAYHGEDMLPDNALARVRYGAYLHRKLGLPVLVTGGSPGAVGTSEGEIMARTLENEFGMTAKWRETASENTWENASFSRRILQQEGIERIVLVTHAFHMQRAINVFNSVGFDVVPAPMGFTRPSRPDVEGEVGLFDLLPKVGAMQDSYFALHEILGMEWYRLRRAIHRWTD